MRAALAEYGGRTCSDLPFSLSLPTSQDALLHGCIPVAIMDNTLNALCTHLDCAAFSVRVAEKDIERLGDIVDAIPQASFSGHA